MSEKPQIPNPFVEPDEPSTSSAENEKNDPSLTTDEAKILAALENPKHIQRVVREGILLAGGAVAILLQVSEPGVAIGVDKHSNFDYRPMDRLRTTMTYIYCMVFGTAAEKAVVVDMVHRAHASIKGEGYSADDPELQLWVAATLYAAGTDIYERMFGALGDAEAEQLYREYSVLAVSLRVRPGMWPPTRRAFWEYWDEKVETLEVSEHARNVARDLLYNKKLPLYVRVAMPLVRLSTAQMLPGRLREGFGLKSTKTRRRMFALTLGFTKATYPCLPKVVRTYPKRYYLKDMRRRLDDMA